MKKTLRRMAALALALIFVFALVPAGAETAPKELTVLFTHDTHDHFYPDAADRGGFVRLAALLKQERAAAQAAGQTVITVDAGDFSMGSLFQTVYASDAPELRALGAMGYDVTTFGNHEYDYRPQGLARMLSAAKASGERLPAIVQANYKTAKDPSAQVAVDAMNDFPVTDYTVLERDGLRIAVFGVMGVDSDECAPMSGMVLEPLIDAAKRVVADIKAKENPDFIIALSHSGTEDRKGEDYELAKAVPDIDLIVSGHTHSTLETPIDVNGTYVVSCGEYTKNLGKITLRKGGECTYELIPIDNSISWDQEMTALADGYKTKVNENYLSEYGFTYDQVLCTPNVEFTIPQMGDYIGQAYIDAVKKVEGADYVPIAFAVTPDGVIRDVVRPGEMTTSEAFDILSLGVGADGTPGYPLISLYLTGRELKNAFEVDASVSSLMPAATLYGAGSRWTYNPHRMFLDRLTDCSLYDSGLSTPIYDDQLYRVVADLYSGQMLSTVKEKSFGLLSVTPLDQKGNEITDFETCIIHDQEGNEVKSWYALASRLAEDGQVQPLPSSKTIAPSWNPLKLLWPMGLPTLVVTLVGLLLIALIVFIIVLICRKVKRKKNGGYRPYQGRKR